MERLDHYTKRDAKAVLSKHQHKATPHRVDVLFYMMDHRRAFTFKKLVEIFEATTDRATVHRILAGFVEIGIVNKVLNEKGHTCFFFKDHLDNADNTFMYLECQSCDEIFALPAYPGQYLDQLSSFQTSPLNTLLKGNCNRTTCTSKST